MSTVVNMQIRSEQPQDIASIESVTIAAFRHADHTSHTEQFIVRALRSSGQLSVSLVAVEGGNVIGHVALSPVSISAGAVHWYGLGPISVHPEYQGRGVGSQLMEQALAQLHHLDASGCVVLGDPDTMPGLGSKQSPRWFCLACHPSIFRPSHLPARFHQVQFRIMRRSNHRANKSLHLTAIPPRSMAASELRRYESAFCKW